MPRALPLRLLFWLVAVFLSPRVEGQQVLNGIAAVVNNEVITFSQVRELVSAKEAAAAAQFKGEALMEKIKEIRLQAINDLIDRQLILEEFKRQKFQIPDYFLDDRIQTIIREEFGGDRQAFVRTLEAQGYSLQRFKEQERDKAIVQEMRRSAVKGNPIVSQTKIQEYYDSHPEEYASNDQMKLRMIAVKKSGASDSRRKMIQEIRTKIMDGAEFGDLAHMYSEHSTQEQYGDWGWIDRKTLNEELTNAAFALRPGEVSEVLEIGDTYYLLFCEAKKPATRKPFAEVRDEIEKRLQQQERQRLQQEWLLKLRKKAFIKMF